MAKHDDGRRRHGAHDFDEWSRTHGVKIHDPEGRQAIAQYVGDMAGQLEVMARSAKLEMLAYLLSIARMEAELITRAPDGGPPL